MFERVRRLAGDQGARSLLAGLEPGQIVEIDAAGSDVSSDVDTPDDLAAAGRHDRPF
jgi:CTP:molybdopterin cytidylyltransferase MocA